MEYFKERKRWLFLGLPWTFTVYTVNEEIINIKSGLLKTIEDDCYMYKVTDVELERSLFEKMFGLGTVVCFTGDTTHHTLRLSHIKNSKAIKDYILKMSEEQRLKRRTLNTQSLTGHFDEGDFDSVDHM